MVEAKVARTTRTCTQVNFGTQSSITKYFEFQGNRWVFFTCELASACQNYTFLKKTFGSTTILPFHYNTSTLRMFPLNRIPHEMSPSFALRTYFLVLSPLRNLRNNNCFKANLLCFLRQGSRVDRFRPSRSRRWQPHWSSCINHGWKSPTVLIQNAQVTEESRGSESWHGNSVYWWVFWWACLSCPGVWPQSLSAWGC